MLGQRSDINNSFRIIIIKINAIKTIIMFNVTKIYTWNTYFVTGKCDIARIFVNKDYIIITEYSIMKL